ncbi:MAG: sensor signal transduction histidine kinase [Pedosphaera sp.]|nr:sensor signal transduction histidine kinase [Pedosphaera sp.]
MRFFRNASLKRKQTLIIMLTTSVALLLACAVFATYEVITFRKTMVRNLSTLAEIVGNNTAAALDFNDPKAAAETLAALKAEPNIVAACIYSEEGGVFARYDRVDHDRNAPLPNSQPAGHTFGQRQLVLFRPIIDKGGTIGGVYLESDLEALYSRLRQYGLILTGVFLVTSLVAFFLSDRLQRLISKPILDLVQTTRVVARDRNYSLRAVKQNEDDIGVLIDGFNEMLTQIQERDAALQDAQGHLERRVAERTEELANSLSLLRATLESTADGVLVTDAEENVVSFNDQFINMWGIPNAAAVPADRQKLQAVMLAQLKAPEAALAKMREIQERPEAEGSEVLEFKDGRIFERYSKPQWIGEKSVGRVWSCRDVTERKRAEVTSLAFSKLGQSLMSATTAHDAARSITNVADELFGWDACAFYLYAAETDKIEPVLSVDTTAGRRVDVLAAGEPKTEPSVIDRRIIENGAHLTLKEGLLTMEAGAIPYGDKSRPSACIMRVPVRAGNRITGLLNIHSYTPQAYTRKDLAMLQTLADYCGGALERIWAEAELDNERDLLRALLDNSPDCIYFKDLNSRFLLSSKSMGDQFGVPAQDLLGKSDFDFFEEKHAKEAYDDEQQVIHTGRSLIGKVENETLKSGPEAWMLTSKLPLRNKAGEIIGTFGISKNITAIKDSEAQLKKAHEQLLTTSRLAGMAEVATSVLHNVGNVLNSVNISSSVVSEKVRNSKVVNLAKAVALMQSHAADLPGFFAHDPQGRQLPAYLDKLATHLTEEQAGMLEELASLVSNVEHIKEIVAMQQSYARVSGLLETLSVVDLVEDALRMNAGAMERHQVRVIREFSPVPPMLVEKHKVLQILVNLIRNAKYAVDDNQNEDKRMTLRVTSDGDDLVQISVIDNGVGIPAENLTRIFNHGFTTKKEGHGFGLHSGALAAKELGGALSVHSDGPGKGATFTLKLSMNGKK